MSSSGSEVFDEIARRYHPLITVEEAAEIARAPRATIHGWSSAGKLDRFKHKSGRRILLRRDEFVRFLLNQAAREHSDDDNDERVVAE